MKTPVIDEKKLPEAMQIIDNANTLVTDRDCENDEAAHKEIEELQNKLRQLTGNQQIQIRDFWRYDEATDLETAAKEALMEDPEKEELTDEQIKEVVLNILNHDEAEMDWWLNYLTINTGLDNLTDYIFYPDLIGLDRDASLEKIADKINADRK